MGGESVAGKALKSGSGWRNNGNGTDSFGFSALPAGSGYKTNDYFFNDGLWAYFWFATESVDKGFAYKMSLEYDSEASRTGSIVKGMNVSVRCVRD